MKVPKSYCNVQAVDQALYEITELRTDEKWKYRVYQINKLCYFFTNDVNSQRARQVLNVTCEDNTLAIEQLFINY